VFNEDLLTQYKELQFKGQHIELALLPNKKKEYKVEEIRKYWKQGWKIQFLVHWKGYRDEHDQWITKTGLSHAKEMIKDYW